MITGINTEVFKENLLNNLLNIDLLYYLNSFSIINLDYDFKFSYLSYDGVLLEFLSPIFPDLEISNYYLNVVLIEFDSFYNDFFSSMEFSYYNITFFLFFYSTSLYFFSNYYDNLFEEKRIFFFKEMNSFFFFWVKFCGEKIESLEESVLLLKFISFFFFIFFSHYFSFCNFLNFYLFIEWVIPVIFGILMISENIWLFSSHIFIYLNGSRGRRFFFITILEDIINFSILVIRILLQIIRGVICDLYHEFFREISIFFLVKLHNYFFFWNYLFYFKGFSFFWSLYLLVLKLLAFIIILTLAVILMFLQILFLFLAVWLFCKCWFISTYTNIESNMNPFYFSKMVRV